MDFSVNTLPCVLQAFTCRTVTRYGLLSLLVELKVRYCRLKYPNNRLGVPVAVLLNSPCWSRILTVPSYDLSFRAILPDGCEWCFLMQDCYPALGHSHSHSTIGRASFYGPKANMIHIM